MFFFSSRRRHTRWTRDCSSDVGASDLARATRARPGGAHGVQTGQGAQRAQQYADAHVDLAAYGVAARSEERRVGKAKRTRGWRCLHSKREKTKNRAASDGNGCNEWRAT